LKSNRGFTIIETLLAVVILSSALLLLTNSWSSSFMKIRKTQQNFEVAALLERKMTELEIEYRGKSLESIPEEREDSFGGDSNLEAYSWKMESQQLEIPDFSGTLTAQEGGADPFLISLVKQLSEGLSKAVKEMKVTVIYKPPKGKAMNYSATMYFVDYDKELAIGMPNQ
jgi:general secretion pathway protein I